MKFHLNDQAAHSGLLWTWDDPVYPGPLILEIVKLLRANRRNNKFCFPQNFVPMGQVDMLAQDISNLFSEGFTKEATDNYARLAWPNDSDRRDKLILICDLVRGTLLASGDIRVV
jgi:hypothetical protein